MGMHPDPIECTKAPHGAATCPVPHNVWLKSGEPLTPPALVRRYAGPGTLDGTRQYDAPSRRSFPALDDEVV